MHKKYPSQEVDPKIHLDFKALSHDLKNLLAKQSLIVSNAGKHWDTPAFINHVIQTIENSVTRMT